jgi:hypothetical protein
LFPEVPRLTLIEELLLPLLGRGGQGLATSSLLVGQASPFFASDVLASAHRLGTGAVQLGEGTDTCKNIRSGPRNYALSVHLSLVRQSVYVPIMLILLVEVNFVKDQYQK